MGGIYFGLEDGSLGVRIETEENTWVVDGDVFAGEPTTAGKADAINAELDRVGAPKRFIAKVNGEAIQITQDSDETR